VTIGRNHNRARSCTGRTSSYQKLIRADYYCTFDIAKFHAWAAQIERPKSASNDTYLASWKSGCRVHGRNPRPAIDALLAHQTV
jgi:hypothetical protein